MQVAKGPTASGLFKDIKAKALVAIRPGSFFKIESRLPNFWPTRAQQNPERVREMQTLSWKILTPL